MFTVRLKNATDVVVGTTLASGEDSHVDSALNIVSVLVVFAEEDQSSTGTTKSLVAAGGESLSESTDVIMILGILTWWW